MIDTLTKEQKYLTGIYSITNIVNGKRYIGLAGCLNDRYRYHKSDLNRGVERNPHLQLSYNKYGPENFKFELVNLCSLKDLNDMEIYFIKAFDTTNRDKGYNITEGGKRPKIAEESKIKMSIAKKGIPLTEEHKNNVSIGLKNIFAAGKRVQWCTGKKLSEEHKEKIRINTKLNTKHRCKKIKQYDLSGNYIKTFDSISDASQEVKYESNKKNRHTGTLVRAIKKNFAAYGFKWSY